MVVPKPSAPNASIRKKIGPNAHLKKGHRILQGNQGRERKIELCSRGGKLIGADTAQRKPAAHVTRR